MAGPLLRRAGTHSQDTVFGGGFWLRFRQNNEPWLILFPKLGFHAMQRTGPLSLQSRTPRAMRVWTSKKLKKKVYGDSELQSGENRVSAAYP